jgi:multidrug efflux pump subunit AcrA (membrane-fusion protein)
MKNLILIIITLLLVSCGGGSNKSFEEIVNSKDLKAIRDKKNELVHKQKDLNEQIGILDEKIAKLDKVKRVSLITTLTIEEQIFNHYLELQGSVTTKELLVLFPEYSGTLLEVLVKNGQKVKKGQLLAKIDDGGLNQQLVQLQIQEDLAQTT